MRATLLITTFVQRAHLLALTLPSIVSQDLSDVEVLVLNDGDADDETQAICQKHGVSYLHTGGHPIWRGPCCALNIGAKAAKGDILIISCAEMLHLNNCIEQLIIPFDDEPHLMTIPEGRQDVDGKYLKALRQGKEGRYGQCGHLKTHLPFLMGVNRQDYIDIGGYDEDFAVGQAFDDNDIVDRLLGYGCSYRSTKARTVHLYHTRKLPGREVDSQERWKYNKILYTQRKGIIHRNTDREWGVL